MEEDLITYNIDRYTILAPQYLELKYGHYDWPKRAEEHTQVPLELFEEIKIRIVTQFINMLFKPWMQRHKLESWGGYEDLPIYTETLEEKRKLLGLQLVCRMRFLTKQDYYS